MHGETSMRLYHGTLADQVDSIIEQGLLPSSQSGLSNYEDKLKSDPCCVYLTDSLAPFYAFLVEPDDLEIGAIAEKIGIIEVDFQLLDRQLLEPDEDWVKNWDSGLIPPNLINEERDEWVHENKRSLRGHWEQSLQQANVVAYRAPIDPPAMLRASRVTGKEVRRVVYCTLMPGFANDPRISSREAVVGFCDRFTQWAMGTDMSARALLGGHSEHEIGDILYRALLRNETDNTEEALHKADKAMREKKPDLGERYADGSWHWLENR